MLLSENQVFAFTAIFFAVIAATGFCFAFMARKADGKPAASISPEEQARVRLQQFDEELQSRLREVDAHVAQAHAAIDRQVASVS